jgi:flagellar hook-basal body complex protein FliE
MDPVMLKTVPAVPEPLAAGPKAYASHAGPGFGELLTNAVASVNNMQLEAAGLEDAVAKGEQVNIHQAVIAGEKAELSFKLLTQVRNKLVDAYEEIMRMQV